MSSSILLMITALSLGLFGLKAASHIATGGTVATAVGGMTGFMLLLDYPLSVKCVLLSIYVLGVAMLYVYGFGAGKSDSSRLIRHSANVQK
jgi:membrane protein implicated in regulation of membrane protease activity